jgi:hypothetical protein
LKESANKNKSDIEKEMIEVKANHEKEFERNVSALENA